MAGSACRHPAGWRLKGYAWVLLLVACTLSFGALAKDPAACKSSSKSSHKAAGQCAHKSKKTHSTKKTGHKAQAAAAAPCDSAGTAVAAGSDGCALAVAAAPLPPALKPHLHPDSACFAALGASKASRHLASKVPFFLDHAPDEGLLANKGHPDKMEKTELASVVAGYGMCLDMADAWRRETYPPEVLAVLDAYWNRTKSLLDDLRNGRLSYGEAARAVALNDNAYKTRVDGLVADLQSRSSHEAQNMPDGTRVQ